MNQVETKNQNKQSLLRLASGVLAVLMLLVSLGLVQAAPSASINYQGKLTDASSTPVVDDDYDFTLTIWDDPSAGACVWSARGTCGTPTAKTVATQDGVFATELGGSGDNALNLDFNSDYWLELAVGTDSPMTPRRKINGSAYSLNSLRLDGQAASYYLNTSADAQTKAGNLTVQGNMAVGTDTSSYLSIYGGNASGDIRSTNGAITLTPIAGSNFNIDLSTTGDFAVNTDQFYIDTSSGHVGIGLSAPSAYLNLKAGVAAAGGAPLKFTAGTNLTLPEAGALEWDGINLFITQTTGPTRKTLAYADDPKYAGFVGNPSLTDNNDGTVTVADQDVYFYVGGSFGTELVRYTLTGGTTGAEFPALPDQTTSYLVAYYNSGSPAFEFITDKAFIDYETYLPHTTVYRSGTRVHTQNWDLSSYALAEKIAYRLATTEEYAREFGLEISTRDNAGTPEFQIEAGVVWTDAERYELPQQAYDSSSFFSRHVGGVWTTSYRNANTDINNTQYDNGTDLQTLSDGFYTINYIYRGVENQNHVYLMLSNQEYEWEELALASHDQIDIPDIISSHAVMVGRIIIQKNASSGVVQSAFHDTFQTDVLISNHSILSNLAADDHSQYALLAGRGSGQLLTGGTTDAGFLVLRTTSGNAVSGADMLFQTGNNGNVEAMKIAYDGTVDINTKLGILESTGATYRTFFQGGDQSADITYTLPTNNNTGFLKNTAGTWSWNSPVLADISIPTIGSPTVVTDLGTAYDYMWSAGVVSGGDITDNGDGTVDIAAGEAMLRTSASQTAPLKSVTFPATNNIALTDNATNYLWADYNSGTPQVGNSTVLSDFNCMDKCHLYTVVRDGIKLYILDGRQQNIDANRKLRRKNYDTNPFAHVSGGSSLTNSNRYLAVTAGAFWYSLEKMTHSAFDTSVAGTSVDRVFMAHYQDGSGGWTSTADEKQIDNTQYDDGDGTLGTLTNSYYGVHWVYLVMGQTPELMTIYGRGDYATLDAAKAEGAPGNSPAMIGGAGVLIGRVIIQKSNSTIDLVESAFSSAFGSAGVTDHSNLSGLLDDDHTQYALLAGRSGGQMLIGGTGTTDDLILRSTAGNAVSGADMIFQTGNNGATEAMRILYDGSVGVGVSNPTQGLLTVNGNIATLAQNGLRLYDTDNSNYSGFKANSATTQDSVYSLPAAYPGSNAFMKSDASGNLSWDTTAYMTNPMTTVGDIIYGGAGGVQTRLAGSATDGWVLAYNTATNAPYWMNPGTAIMSIGSAVTSSTPGSVLFVDSSNQLAQSNANFFWDTATNRLGIGDSTPLAALTVGSGDLFQVNSSGAIAASVGITSVGGDISFNNNSNFSTSISTGTSTGTITLGGGSAPLVIDSTGLDVSIAGTLTIPNSQAYTGAGSVTLSSAAASGLTINSGTTGAIAIGDDASAETIALGTGAAAKTLTIGSTNTTSVTTIQSGSGGISFQANGTGTGNVQVGDGGATSATPDMLVLDIGSAEPTGTNGAMYYSTALNKFRCYENGAWNNCITAEPDAATFSDTTAAAWTDNDTTELFNDATKPNIVTNFTTSTVLVTVQIYGQVSNTAADAFLAARIVRTTNGTDPSCASATNVGIPMIGGFTTAATHPWQVVGTFIDSPATAGTIKYTVCTSADSTGTTTDTPERVTVNLVELGADLAENYYTQDDSIQSGDVVAINGFLSAGIEKSEHSYQSEVIGVVSTTPKIVLDDATGMGQGRAVPVALSGRIPVKVSTENGRVKAGDYLTSSSVPGVAMKATKAGLIIGQALHDFNYAEGEIGLTMTFVKNGYFNGEKLLDNDGQSLAGVGLLQRLLLGNSAAAISEIVSDRIAAGLEIVTPKVTADTVALNGLTAATGTDITMTLAENGRLNIADMSGQTGITFDGEGNATFAGTVTADAIVANRIVGLEIYTDKVSGIDASVSDLVARLNALTTDAQNDAAVQPTADGLADNMLAISTIEDLKLSGAITVGGDATFKGKTVFEKIATFFGDILIKGKAKFAGNVEIAKDLTVTGKLIQNQDAAGYAVIKEGAESVRVEFVQEYAEAPVVNATLSLQQIADEEVRKATEELLLVSDVRFVVTNVTTKGFEIRILGAAASDIPLSWQATAVAGARTSESPSEDSIQPAPEAGSDTASGESVIIPTVDVPPGSDTSTI